MGAPVRPARHRRADGRLWRGAVRHAACQKSTLLTPEELGGLPASARSGAVCRRLRQPLPPDDQPLCRTARKFISGNQCERALGGKAAKRAAQPVRMEAASYLKSLQAGARKARRDRHSRWRWLPMNWRRCGTRLFTSLGFEVRCLRAVQPRDLRKGAVLHSLRHGLLPRQAHARAHGGAAGSRASDAMFYPVPDLQLRRARARTTTTTARWWPITPSCCKGNMEELKSVRFLYPLAAAGQTAR